MSKILRNRARCRRCGDTIESLGLHDWKSCECGAIFVDGGRCYFHRGEERPGDLIDLSEFEPDPASL